jgi:hypothetical protein
MAGTFAEAPTIFSPLFKRFWTNTAEFSSSALGENLALSNPFRNLVAVYLHTAGAEAGYGFFAPNVPSNYKLVFEIRYTDDRRDYDVPRVADAATAFRLESLLERIDGIPYEPMRRVMVQMLTYPAWQRHPDAIFIRSVLGYTLWPSPEDYLKGERESFEPVYGYDFDLRPDSGQSPPRQ